MAKKIAASEPTRKQRQELRVAALRRWGPQDNIESMAARLNVPVSWMWVALRGSVKACKDHWGGGAGAEAAAAKLELPHDFVKWAFRHLFVMARKRRHGDFQRESKRVNRERSSFVDKASGRTPPTRKPSHKVRTFRYADGSEQLAIPERSDA